MPVGGYPSEQNIIKIDSITVYMSADTELDVIVGLIVTYKVREGYTTTSVTVMHGDAMCSECYARSPLRPYSATIIICHTWGSNSPPHYDTDHY